MSFRCRLCHSTLLPESYTGGSETGSLICTFHPTDDKSTSVEPDQRLTSTGNGPKCKFQAGVYSLGGLAIPSVPHYTKPTETQDGLVCKTSETDETEREERSGELKDEENSSVGPPGPRLPRVKDTEEAEKDDPEQKEKPDETKASDVSSTRPVPAPRRISCGGPVPAPRTKSAQMMNGSNASGKYAQCCFIAVIGV